MRFQHPHPLILFGCPTVRRLRLTILLSLIGLVSPVSAQQSRTEEIAEQQEEKSKRLTPNLETHAERLLEWFEAHFTDPSTVYATFGGTYPSGGFAPGIAWRHARGHARLNLGGAWSVRNYKLAHSSIRFPDLAGDRLDIEAHARWLDATQVPYYGFGNSTERSDRTNFGLRSSTVGGSVAFKPAPWFRVGGGVDARLIEDRAGGGRHPSIDERHSPVSAPGLFASTTYIQTNAFAAIDRRESPGYSRRGGLYSVSLHNFQDENDAFSFRRVDAEFTQLVPILKEQWVLGFRALVQTTDVDDDEVVPYYLLPSLGGKQSHRAFTDFRFQDRHLLLLSAEYRWLPSRILDMALFADAGKVTAERNDLNLDGLKAGFGIGVRFHGPTFTPLRIDVARGSDGFRVHFTGGMPF